jgi:hypothetical protein
VCSCLSVWCSRAAAEAAEATAPRAPAAPSRPASPTPPATPPRRAANRRARPTTSAPEEQTYAIVAANTADIGTIPPKALYVFAFDNALGIENRESSTGTAYRVESDQPVTVYQFNPLDNSTEVFSNDASLLFPAHVLDRDYTAVTGDGTRLGLPMDFNAGAFVTVVADQGDTTMTSTRPRTSRSTRARPRST